MTSIEYAINQLTYNNTNSSNVQRSANLLYNGGSIPFKGAFNGWRFAKNSQNILNWNLYNNKKDKDISYETLEYFWVIINRNDGDTNNPQTVNFQLTGASNTITNNISLFGSSSLPSQAGKYLIWYTPSSTTLKPTNSKFDLIPDDSQLNNNFRIVFSDSSYIMSSLINLNLILQDTGSTYNLYIESYGYSTVEGTTFNLALNIIKNLNISEANQIYLNNEGGYNNLLNNFINPDTTNYSAYPVDNEEQNKGLYFNSSASLNLNLLSLTNDYSEFYTIFFEVIITSNSSFTIGMFNTNVNLSSLNPGRQILYIKNNPNNIFSDLSVNVTSVNITSMFTTSLSESLGSIIYTIDTNSDIELLSYGYKLTNSDGYKYNCKWSSETVSPIKFKLDKYVLIGKDVLKETNEECIKENSLFTVKAYGDFISGTYQLPNNDPLYTSHINLKLNQAAVSNAFYFLDYNDTNKYTIDTSGLLFRTDAVAIVNSDGSIVYNNTKINSYSINNKYILGTFISPYTNINANTFFTNYDGTTNLNNSNVFSLNGSINNIILQALYASAFKQFNKSVPIINDSLQTSINNLFTPVSAPPHLHVILTDIIATNLSFTNINTSTYVCTYITATGETERSCPSKTIEQSSIKYQYKLFLPISNDVRVIGRNIYRSDNLGSYYLVTTIKNNITKEWYDYSSYNLINNPDINIIKSYSSDNKNARLLLYPDPNNNLGSSSLDTLHNYYYKITYYNAVTTNESVPSLASVISIPENSCPVMINLPIPSLEQINTYGLTGYRIYRKYFQDTNYYLLTTINNFNTYLYFDYASNNSITSNPILGSYSIINSNCTVSLKYVNSSNFALVLYNNISNNLGSGIYKYKITYYTVNSETDSSVFYDFIYQDSNTGSMKVLLTLPISLDKNVIGRKIYRTQANGSILYYLETISNNNSTVFIDDNSDSLLNINIICPTVNTTLVIAPTINTTVTQYGLQNPISDILAKSINETNIPINKSCFYSIYNCSERLVKDANETLVDKRKVVSSIVNMNLENLEITFRCKLRGLVQDLINNNPITITKKTAEIIFGKFNNNINGTFVQPSTMIRQVIRYNNQNYGLDENYYKMNMINNTVDIYGKYLVNQEIQYEIIFDIVLIQKK